MEITSLVFLAFVGVTFIVYYLIPKKYQWVVLLSASLLFFVTSSSLLTLYMLFTTAVIYFGAKGIQKYKDEFAKKKKELQKPERKVLKEQLKKKQKKILIICIVVVIAVLVLTKYCNFLGGIVNGIASIFTSTDLLPEFNILLPLGISYYTLMSVSYITDVYRGTIKAEVNPLRVLLFVCYFPHIVEGPFDRYGDLDTQFRTPHKFDYERISNALIIMLYGFFKKLVLADRVGLTVSDYFDTVTNNSSLIGLGCATLGYTLQLYFDFSGCIDIIRGVSEIFGIKVAENFKQPFFSKSIDEFWRRWHISLGAWLKEYVFYPVSLSGHFKKVNTFTKKHIKSQHIVGFITIAYTLFFVWFCNGLWHGASWLYIVYGLYYYVLMMLGKFTEPYTDKLAKKLHINKESKGYSVFQVARTVVIVNVGMLLFRSSTLVEFGKLFGKMFTSINFMDFSSIIKIQDGIILAVGFVIMLLVGIIKEKGIDIRMWLIEHNFVIRWLVYYFLLFSTIILGAYGIGYGGAAAIYAQF